MPTTHRQSTFTFLGKLADASGLGRLGRIQPGEGMAGDRHGDAPRIELLHYQDTFTMQGND
jgi:hypothetical protein